MATTTPVTELDFDNLKSEIIAFIKTNPTFSDYNFEGSALNAIADILAYNSSQNAFYANMLHSESFLDTAQRRASVVSKAKELGYVPKSATASIAYIDLTVVGGGSNPNPMILYRGDSFSASNENGNYTFLVKEDVSAEIVGADQKFTQVHVCEGVRIQNHFIVNTSQNLRLMFTIPNKNIDKTTLKVFVRNNINSIERTEYSIADDIFALTPLSTSYFLQETQDGLFQIYFGGDVIGIAPIDGNVIDIDYFTSTASATANGCSNFTLNGNIGGFTNLNITTTQVSFGGADKEELESIRFNAVKANTSKNRAVTISDYESELIQKYPFIKSVAVWGGEDNVPPIYGKVFLSLQPVAGYTISDSMKRDTIIPSLRKSSMMTVIPEIIDPNYISMEFISRIKFNSTKSTTSQFVVEGQVKTAVIDYINSISKFKNDFLQSNLITKILSTNPGIVAANVSKNIGFKVAPLINRETTYVKNVNNSIRSGSVKSTKFKVYWDGQIQVVSIKEITGKKESVTDVNGKATTVQYLGLYSDTGILVREIGTVNMDTGIFNISFSVFAYVSSISSYRFIQINCTLIDEDISSVRNQILMIEDLGEDPSIGLLNNNQVITELYGK